MIGAEVSPHGGDGRGGAEVSPGGEPLEAAATSPEDPVQTVLAEARGRTGASLALVVRRTPRGGVRADFSTWPAASGRQSHRLPPELLGGSGVRPLSGQAAQALVLDLDVPAELAYLACPLWAGSDPGALILGFDASSPPPPAGSFESVALVCAQVLGAYRESQWRRALLDALGYLAQERARLGELLHQEACGHLTAAHFELELIGLQLGEPPALGRASEMFARGTRTLRQVVSGWLGAGPACPLYEALMELTACHPRLEWDPAEEWREPPEVWRRLLIEVLRQTPPDVRLGVRRAGAFLRLDLEAAPAEPLLSWVLLLGGQLETGSGGFHLSVPLD